MNAVESAGSFCPRCGYMFYNWAHYWKLKRASLCWFWDNCPRCKWAGLRRMWREQM